MSGNTEEMSTVGSTVADVMRRLAPTPEAAQQFEHGLRADAVQHLTGQLLEFVQDGDCDCLIRITRIPLDKWRAVTAEEYPHSHGLPLKKEWLTGLRPHIVVEYEAADFDEPEEYDTSPSTLRRLSDAELRRRVERFTQDGRGSAEL